MRSKPFKATKEQSDFIFKNYKGISNRDLTDMFNQEFGVELKIDIIKNFKSRNKLDSGLTGYFKKGQIPFNKGLKWDDFMSKEGQANSKKTTFKKGYTHKNTKELGTQLVDAEGYLYIKVNEKGKRYGRDGKWQRYHHIVWENAHGPIPDGYMVMFLDKDRTNFDLDNLQLVSKSELSTINKNSLYQNNRDINLSLIYTIRLVKKYNQIIENKENKK